MTRRKFFPVFDLNQASHQPPPRLPAPEASGVDRRLRRGVLTDRQHIWQHDVDDDRPRGIISSAQTLSQESREIIERAFHAKVFDKYGSCEFSGIAHECEVHAGYHVNAESYIVEIVRDGKPVAPGEVGEVLITDLTNRSVPMIRYALGDLVTATDRLCPCGRGLPLIGAVQGRVQSIIIGTNGSFLPGAFFPHAQDYGHILRQFQVVQERLGAIEFNIVEGPRFSPAALRKFWYPPPPGDDMVDQRTLG